MSEIESFCEDAIGLDWDQTTDADHDRKELRRHAVSEDNAWLSGERRIPGEPRFPGLAAIAMVEAEVERGRKRSRERRYDLCSTPIDARLFARAVRARSSGKPFPGTMCRSWLRSGLRRAM